MSSAFKNCLRVVRSILIGIGTSKKDDEWFRKKWAEVLLAEKLRVLTATGDTPHDYLYDEAERIESTTFLNYIWVWYEGRRYGPAFVSWGPLDGDPSKFTVLIKTDGGKWVKLWFYKSQLSKASEDLNCP